MNEEIFTKTGELKKRAPKKYVCKECNHKTSKPSTVKTIIASFSVCNNCGGTVKKNDSYIEWEKRSTGQWEMEKEILSFVSSKGEVSKEDIEKHFGEAEKDTFARATSLFGMSFSELVYWGKLTVRKENESYYYKLSKETVKS